jgi:Ser/Thr protein kinase RdoA (MazF antagonist)
MPAPMSPITPQPLLCPTCGRLLDDLLVVNPAGELIGCEDCAAGLGLAGGTMTLDEWNATSTVEDVLGNYSLQDAQFHKPTSTPTQRPRAHYWEVLAGNKRYFLKRFHDWYPVESIDYTHSILAHLFEEGLPVSRVVNDQNGANYCERSGSSWALYAAREGHQANENDWMWGRPKAAEALAALHNGLETCTPEGSPFQPWNAWTLDTVESVLESWQPLPELPEDLLSFVRDRLAHRYFGDLYPQLPKIVVHGDFTSANVLWRGESSNATISGVLDFERAHLDTGLYDLAWGLGDRRPPLLRATVAAYHRVRPLSPIEREALPEAMLLGLLMGIDMQMNYYHNMREVGRLAHDLSMTVRDLESLRKAVAIKTPGVY